MGTDPTMDGDERAKGKKRLPWWIRFPLWVAFGGVLILIATITASIGLYLSSPVSPPPITPRIRQADSTTRTLIGSTLAPASRRDSFTSSMSGASVSTAALGINPDASVPAPSTKEAADCVLVAEAAQPTAGLKAKARAINENFTRLGVEFESYMLEKKKRTDPDEMTGEETRALRAVHERVALVRRDLRSGFGAAEVERFDGLYLGMLAERKDWHDAAIFCANIRGNWKETRYCCRQMEPGEGVVYYAAMKFCKFATGSADLDFAE